MALNPDFHRLTVSRVSSSVGSQTANGSDEVTFSGRLDDGTACAFSAVFRGKKHRFRCLVDKAGLDVTCAFLDKKDADLFLKRFVKVIAENDSLTTETTEGLFTVRAIQHPDTKAKTINFVTPSGGASLSLSPWQSFYFHTSIVAILRTHVGIWK